MSSSVCISGDKPPWTHRNCWFISAANGRQSNASIQASYTRSVYLILPEKKALWTFIYSNIYSMKVSMQQQSQTFGRRDLTPKNQWSIDSVSDSCSSDLSKHGTMKIFSPWTVKELALFRKFYLRRLDSFDCRKLAMYMLSNGKKILLLFCELFIQFHNNLHLGCNAGDFYKYLMTFYMKDKPKCVIPLIIPEYFK